MPTLEKNEISAPSLYQLLGAPMHALVDAETQAAEATAQFITQFGFEPVTPAGDGSSHGSGELGKLRMASFTHQRPGPDNEPRTYKIEVPFLSLLPIPALQVKDAEFDFYLKIIDTQPQTGDKKNATQDKTQGMEPIELKASMGRGPSDKAGNRSTEVHMRVKMRVEQADIPAGLAKLFNLMEEQIAVVEQPKQAKTPQEAETKVDADDDVPTAT